MKIEWISHRGESADAPENTAAAFELARDRATQGSECDVHFSMDGKLMVSHDCTTERMGDRVLTIESSTAEELRKVNLTGRHRAKYGTAMMPFFTEALALLGTGRKFYIELKHPDSKLADAVKEQTAAAGLTDDQIIIISFHAEACRYAKTVFPASKVLWLTGDDKLAVENLIQILRDLKIDGVDAKYSIPCMTADGVRKLHEAGFHVAVWTVDQPDDARRMIEIGVDSITSNCAASLMKKFSL